MAAVSEAKSHIHNQPSSARDVTLELVRGGSIGDVKHHGFTITWSQLDLAVPTDDGADFQILHGVSGIAHPGRVLAMMGPSGAGKTTLVECLAQRAQPTGGSISFNGHPWNPKMSRLLAYCHQLDLFRPNLTVREHLYINAKLRMDANTTEEQINSRVDDVINRLGLAKCQETLIGAPGLGGISGGERKRLSIAAEILNRPAVIFLDEPTSGLDSFMAASIMKLLKEISQGIGGSPVTVVAIIHQPSAEVFEELEDLSMMAAGHTAFYGKAKELVSYCKDIGKPCPSFTNPAEHFMNTISVNPEAIPESKKQIDWMVNAWKDSKNKGALEEEVKLVADASSGLTDPGNQKNPSSCTQLRVLLYREFLDRRRNKLMAIAIVMRSLVFMLFLGSMFYGLGSGSDQKAVQSVTGAIFFIMINQAFTYVIPTVQTFPRELAVFRREYSSGIYMLTPYYFSKVFANLPIDLVMGIVFSPIAFYMIDFSDDPNVFGGFVGSLALITLIATGLGYWVSCMAPNADVALLLAILFVVIPLIPSGFIINLDEVPVYYIWLREASPFTWSFRLLMSNQWENYGDIQCSSRDRSEGFCNDENVPFSDGLAVLSYYGIDPDEKGIAVIVLCCLVVGYHCMAFSFLFLKSVTGTNLAK